MMNKIATKYGLLTLERTLMVESDVDENTVKLDWYKSLLKVTDHIPNKLTERLFETLAGLTITNFISEMLKFAKSALGDYKDILLVRKQCREQINALEQVVEK